MEPILIYNALRRISKKAELGRYKKISRNVVSREKYISIAQYAEGRRVLDIGCSVGFFSLLMSQYATHVIGIDISSHGVGIAQKASELLQITNVDFRVMDFFSITPKLLRKWKIDTIFTHKTFGALGKKGDKHLETLMLGVQRLITDSISECDKSPRFKSHFVVNRIGRVPGKYLKRSSATVMPIFKPPRPTMMILDMI